MAKSLAPPPKFTVYLNGAPASGAKIHTYVGGSNDTPIATYQDYDGTLNANPVVCNSRGECNIWLTPGTSYKFLVTTSADVTIYTVDDIIGPSGSGSESFTSITVTGNGSVFEGSVTFEGPVNFFTDTTITLEEGEEFLVTGEGDTVFQTDVIMDGNATTFINGATIDLPDGTVTFEDLDPSLQALLTSATNGVGSVRGLVALNNSGTPATKWDLTSATSVLVADPDTNEIAVILAPATITIDITVAGPIVNGRDQAGALSAGSWVYMHYIYNGTLTRGLASASATAPTLPSGYTKFALAAAVRLSAGSALILTYYKGSWADYDVVVLTDGPGDIISSGADATKTLVSLAAVVPPMAVCQQFTIQAGCSCSAGTDVARYYAGNGIGVATQPVVGAQTINVGPVFFRNYSQQMYYDVTSGGTVNANLLSFQINNGG